ncbi:sulfatase [Halomarina litorea]|uniref:sulfatase n=1 Tax=Halomarina litorea TaxID=2961595 RepID=UPI0020C2D601|nr:sulfatase [Halomarina sp. BCD28]
MADQPDVLFLVLDSMRRDRVSTYGHHRKTTPTLDALAKRASVFENAFTPAPWTLPSHCSMFTGLFPSEHGVTNGFTDRDLRLAEEFTTVTERLAERGYRTAGFSNNPWVGKLSGLDRGFDEYVEWNLEIGVEGDADLHTRRERLYSRGNTWLGHASRQPLFALKRPFFTSSLTDRAKRWFDYTSGSDDPTFTFMNLMEAHSPYFPPKDAFRKLGLKAPNELEPRLLNTRLLAYVLGTRDLGDDERERVLEFYDAALRYQDAKVNGLLTMLDEQGRLDDTLVVVCADHGKTLGEYDRDGTPPHYVRDINVNVPLLVKWPGQNEGERVEAPVDLTDLHELLLGEAESSEAWADDDVALTEDHVPHTGRASKPVTHWRVLSDSEFKYARSEEGEEFVFERRGDADPANRKPNGERLVEADEAMLAEARRRLDERIETLNESAGVADDADGELDGDVQAQLRDLGYL